jgi:hypothetical protein
MRGDLTYRNPNPATPSKNSVKLIRTRSVPVSVSTGVDAGFLRLRSFIIFGENLC